MVGNNASLMVSIPAFDPIAYLVERRHPSPITELARRYGRRQDATLPLDAAERLEQRNAYAAELKSLGSEELAALVTAAQDEDAAKAEAEAQANERQYFFNQPAATADFNYWAKAGYWTLDEATALSFGRSPAIVNWGNVSNYTTVSRFAAEYALRRDLVLRAKAVDQLYDCSLPGFFLAWLKRNRLDFPAELEAAVLAHGHQVQDWKTAYDDAIKLAEEWKRRYEETSAMLERTTPALTRLEALVAAQSQKPKAEAPNERLLGSRERDSLLKLVIGMAVAGYRFDPRAAKNSATAEIASDLDRLGMPMHPDTVRKWLGEAAIHLPPQGQDD